MRQQGLRMSFARRVPAMPARCRDGRALARTRDAGALPRTRNAGALPRTSDTSPPTGIVPAAP